jgi:4-alpha-glucanotransferase
LSECDGLRIDHPHGWVDPWVYRADDPDSLHAVQNGARLFSTPDDPHHPLLNEFAIARADQIDHSQAAHADRRVTHLADNQVQRYSMLFDQIVESRAVHGRRLELACEVLSTLPYPVECVMDRHDLGRFRVTQKLDLANAADVYRIENARPHDWIMLGTHDTPPIWSLAAQWCREGDGRAWGKYLAEKLVPPSRQAPLAREIAVDPSRLIHACFAAMLASAARNVVVFFPDLLGMTERYNIPGEVSRQNWSLRVPTDFESLFEDRRKRGAALDLQSCFEMARIARHRRC